MIRIGAPDGSVVEFPEGTDDATIATAMRKTFGGPQQQEPMQSGGERPTALEASNRGLVQGLTFGFGDELMAGALTPIEMGVRAIKGQDWSPGVAYDAALQRERAGLKAAQEAHPIATGAGTLAGGVMGGAGLANAGLSVGARAAQAGAGLGRVALGSGVDGALMGAATGFGTGEGGLGERAGDAVSGGLTGAAFGSLAPVAISGAATVARPVLAPIMSRLNPQSYADDALALAMRRANMEPVDVANALVAARNDAQGAFTAADAMGETGQRLLSVAARNPSDARQMVVNALENRQAGQGRRVASALSDAFAAPDTAAQRVAALTERRNAAADMGYGAAREGAGAVDVTPAIASIDETLQPGITRLANPQANIADDSVEGALRRARALLTDGRSNVSDFSVALRAKQELDDMIGQATRAGANNRARLLIAARNQLDQSLEAASPGYADARNAFRQGSQEINAVDAGRAAAMRGRPEDTIPAFQAMAPGEQAAFRAGYVDPLIEGVQSAAVGVNKVRPLLNDATAAEFPAFAAPGQADQLARRLARERTMFETRAEALGNSKTAQRLADDADFAKFEPGIIATFLRGKPLDAAIQAVTRALNEARGMPPAVVERVAATLLETRPDVARRLLQNASLSRRMSDNTRAVANVIGTSLGAAIGGRAF
ncbi:hypothetical protein [Xanthobacter versatilis]|uniref:hypothetical protein n=1 Tax=Xanthobacter autotrophicus (strain ATCC BAA-1158 / Py2) TaxID=78245 RepID=UPI00372A6EC0